MKYRKAEESQRGAMTIVEATFVFPIMFIIVFIMIMTGEAYYQRSRVEYEISHGSVSGAARCENPMLAYIQNNGNAIPSDPGAAKVVPYRYIFTSEARRIGTDLEGELTQTINSMEPLAFRAMSPRNVNIDVKPKLNILVSSLQVNCEFDIQLPIRMLFSKENLKFHYKISTVEPIGDPAEFVRNVSLVQDILDRNSKAQEMYGRIKNALDQLGRFIN